MKQHRWRLPVKTTNHICHILKVTAGHHAQPFVVCDKHLAVARLEYAASPTWELHRVGETDAPCPQCYKEASICKPLEVMERAKTAGVSEEDLETLAFALGYQSLADARLQLKIVRDGYSPDGCVGV